MPDLDRYLYDQMRSASWSVDLPAGDAGAVMARGRARRRRRRGATALVAVAVAGSVTGAVLARSQPHQATNVTIGQPAVTRPASDRLTLQVVPLHSGLSYVTSLSGPSGGIEYAVSTAPGTNANSGTLPGVLYRSSDGRTWSMVNTPSGLSLGDVTVNGDRIYAVGTGPATAAVGSSAIASVQSSTTSSTTWRQTVLPIDLGNPPGLSVVDEVVRVAAAPAGVVAVVGLNATVDLQQLLPAGVTAGPWAATAQGVELLGPERVAPCGAGQSTSPSVSGRGKGIATTVAPTTASSAVGRVSSVSCFGSGSKSPVYRTLSPEQAYPVIRTFTWSQLHLTPDLATSLQGRPLAFYSSDGADFEPVVLPAGIRSSQMAIAAGQTGYVLVGTAAGTSNGLAAVQSADGRQWAMAPPLPGGPDSLVGVGAAGGHITLVAGTSQSASEALAFDGTGWTVAPIPGSASLVGFGPLGVAALTATGHSTGGTTWQLLFSRDGTTWSAASLTPLVGDAVNPANVSVGASQVVVTLTQVPSQPPSPNTPATQVAVVGTPATP